MTSYSDELVELGNQAWILNGALAELHRFHASVERHLASAPAQHAVLEQELGTQLAPAIGRLRSRLQALMTKWTGRMALEAPGETVVVEDQPWGCRVLVPATVRAQLQVSSGLTMELAELQRLAAAYPAQFFVFYSAVGPAAAGQDTEDRSAERVAAVRFAGVPLNVARMWWSWWFTTEWPLCRLQALSHNLWQIDSCGDLPEAFGGLGVVGAGAQ